MMKRIIIFTFVLLISLSLSAQDNTVRLTVSGEGATKEEATANALRSAIEQAFGTFVSANTQILNDDIVKDEIATISSGNIQEYSELGCITMPDGHKSVSLSATVSIGNLISYAKSKGSSAEFAGAVFGMNMTMRKLNAENEKRAIDHLLEQLDILAEDMFRIEVGVKGEPVKIDLEEYKYRHLREKYTSQPYLVNLNLSYHTTPVRKIFFELLYNTLKNVSLSEKEAHQYSDSGEPVYLMINIPKHPNAYSLNNDIKYCSLLRTGLYPNIMNDKYRVPYGGDVAYYFFRTDISSIIIDALHKSLMKAQLSNWSICVHGIDDMITFELIEREYNEYKWGNNSRVKLKDGSYVTIRQTARGIIYENDSHRSSIWRTFPESRYVIHNKSFSHARIIDFDHTFGLEMDIEEEIEDAQHFCSRTMEIVFTEEELSRITGFSIVPNEETFQNYDTTNKSMSENVEKNEAQKPKDVDLVENKSVPSQQEEQTIVSIKHNDIELNNASEKIVPQQVKVNIPEGEPIPYQLVEEKPSFQGGDINQFLKWVRENQIYPEIAKENGIQGRVTVRATINTDGSLTDIMVVRGVDPSLDKEAIRVVSQSPKWKPGKQGGKAVPVTYNFPVNFQIR